nr:transporter substrate-binding domain-containing protein [uncultured Celeribacter sp.]
MKYVFQCLWACVLLCLGTTLAWAEDLKIVTVSRAPFSMIENGTDTGFSIELWDALAADLGWSYSLSRVDTFDDMLGAIIAGEADAAIGNISITADRELQMDFSQPVFEAGLQVMVPMAGSERQSLWAVLLSTGLLVDLAMAFAVLFGVGMLMWFLEKRHQEYFDLPAQKALFPAFWWALNLVVNGGFEERQPRSPLGRILGVALVLASLFVVSVFVARITAMMTVDAIQANVSGLNDLYGRRIGTVEYSTSARFLDRRDLDYQSFDTPDTLFAAFQDGEIDAVVYDAPLLAYYATHEGKNTARVVGKIFIPENYGIALPTNSPYANDINHSLLKLREDGTYETIYRKWFGNR